MLIVSNKHLLNGSCNFATFTFVNAMVLLRGELGLKVILPRPVHHTPLHS